MAGFILWEGTSLYDGAPIVVIATMSSSNVKTGDMIQTWIIRSDIDPIQASRTGQDISICGNCPHMGQPSDKGTGWAKNRACYVNLLHGPNGIYKAYRKGSYKKASWIEIADITMGRMVRVGSYGDPAAVPVSVWKSLVRHAKGWTAYTHAGINPLPDLLMTSSDSLGHAESAWIKGERTFRIISDVSEVIRGKEILCPASKEAGMKSTCASCKLCAGNTTLAKSIAIVAHGNGKKHIKGIKP